MNKTTQISITLNEDILRYIDELALTNGRSRSGMINWILNKDKQSYDDLEKEALTHGKI